MSINFIVDLTWEVGSYGVAYLDFSHNALVYISPCHDVTIDVQTPGRHSENRVLCQLEAPYIEVRNSNISSFRRK